MHTAESHEKRLKQLHDWRKAASNTTLIEKYDRAIALTEGTAVEVYGRLLEAVKAEAEAYDTHTRKQSESITEHLQVLNQQADNAIAEANTETDPGKQFILKLEKGRISREIILENIRLNKGVIMDALQKKIVATVPPMHDALFGSVFEPDQTAFSKDAAFKAIEFAIGIIPGVGTAYDGVKKINDLLCRDKAESKTANDHLAYLDDYSASVEHWCSMAEALIQTLKDREEMVTT